MSDYESLLEKFNESQAECRQLREKLAVTGAELKKLEHALGPAIDEYDQLRHRLQIETGCRTEAEKYACKMRKQNKDLKRRSEQLLEKMQLTAFDIDIEESNTVSNSGSDDDLRDTLNKKIQDLEETVQQLENKLVSAEDEKVTAYERESQHVAKIQSLEEETAELRQQIEDFNSDMKKMKRVSDMAWKEFEELQESHELALKLKTEAERFACQMLSERDGARRQSSVLITSAKSDERLAEALLTIEELTAKQATQQHEHQQQIASLKEELDTSLLDKRVSELESQLSIAMAENERFQKSIKDLEKWKEKLEKENVDLVNKLDVAEQKLRPPPPPPPPPPSLFSPLRLLIKIKKGGPDTSPAKTKAGTVKDQTYEEALKEMMERIQSGRALKPTRDTSQTTTRKDSSSAIDNLQNILSRRQCSVDDLISRQKSEQKAASTENTELMKAFQKFRPNTPVQTDADDTADNSHL